MADLAIQTLDQFEIVAATPAGPDSPAKPAKLLTVVKSKDQRTLTFVNIPAGFTPDKLIAFLDSVRGLPPYCNLRADETGDCLLIDFADNRTMLQAKKPILAALLATDTPIRVKKL